MTTYTTRHRGIARALAAALIAAGTGVAAAGLRPETLAGWTTYVTATETRRAGELGRGDRFLAMDFQPDAAADRRRLLAGEIVVRPTGTIGVDGDSLEVPSAMVHHWRGAVFIRGETVPGLMSALQRDAPPPDGEDVLRSSVIARGPDSMKVYLRLRRQKIVTVVYNTEHDVTFAHYDATRAGSTSVAVKIAEVEDPGTPAEHELAPGDDRGFLWRLNAYWRYQAAPGGVIAECESITLSRSVPSVVRYLAGPLIERAARESMERTLVMLRSRFER